MNNLNITEKYTLCLLKEKKSLYAKEITPYLIISMIIEMMLNGNLEITDKNKIILNNKIPTSSYNEKLYEIIKTNKKEEIPLKSILTSICYSFSNKNLKIILEALKENMVKNELITLEYKKGLIGNKEIVKVAQTVINNMNAIITTMMINATSSV